MSDIKGIKKPVISMNNPLFTIPTGNDTPNDVNMLVEIPKGSFNKYEYNTFTGRIKLDRVLYEFMPYPAEYGIIPQTWDEDEDMLDIMSFVTYPTFPGCLINVRPIGVMYFIDNGQKDDKILSVPSDDVRFKDIHNITDLTDHTLDEIHFFFKYYKDLQYKYKNVKEMKETHVIIDGWGDKKKAATVIEKSIERFNKKFADVKKQIALQDN